MELGRVLWEARTCSRQNRYDKGRIPFCCYPVRASARQFQPDAALQVIEQVKYQSHGGRPLSSNRPSVSATCSFSNHRLKDLRRPIEYPELQPSNTTWFRSKLNVPLRLQTPHRARTKYALEGFSEPLAYGSSSISTARSKFQVFVPSRAVLDRSKTLEFKSTELLKNCLHKIHSSSALSL
jgi:hypothetical protein